MKTLGIVVAVLLALVAIAVVAAPRLIDWNGYRPEIAARLEAALGRRVEINGDLSLSLVPVPALSVEGVRLANVPGAAEPYMATVEAVRLRLAPAALLGGAVRIRSLILVKPRVHLQTFEDGHGNWEFQAAGAPTPAAPEASLSGRGGGGVDLRVEKLVVEDGAIILLRPAAEAMRLDGIDATVSASGADGPVQANGSGIWRGARIEYEIATGRLGGAGTAPLSAVFRLPDKHAEARLAGQIALADAPALRGKLAVSAGNLVEILALSPQAGAPPPGLDKPFMAEGMIEATAHQIDINDMGVRLGDTEGKGALGVKLGERPAIDLTLVFSRIDLDALAATARPAAAQAGDGGVPPAADGVAEPFALPGDLVVRADVSADVALYRGSIVRRAKIEAALDGGVLSVRRASALLPGGSDISVVGTLRQADGRPALDGSFEASSDNLRAVLQWLGVAATEVPADRLRKFSGDGKLHGTLDELVVSDLDLRLDTSRLRGAANIRLAGRPAIGANLVIDNLNVDAYLPAASRPRVAVGGTAAGLPATAATRISALGAFDANLKARIETLTVNDVSVRDVLLDGSLVAGDLTLRQVSAGDFGGAPARISGGIGNLAAGPVAVRDLAYDIRTRQPARMLRLFGVQAGFDAGRLGAIALRGSADGALAALRLSSRLDIAGGQVAMDGTIDAGGEVPSFAVDVAASHPDFAELVRVFVPDYRPAGRLGKAAASGRLQGRGLAASAEGVRVAVGNAEVVGTVIADLTGKPAITARLDAGELVVDDFLAAPRAAFLQRSPSEWMAPSPTPRPVSTRVGPAPEDRPGGAVVTAAAGDPPWSREPLDLAWLDGVSADLSLTAKAVSYGRYRLESVRADASIADNAAVLESLAATLFGGALAMDGRLAGDGAAAGKLAIDGAMLRQTLAASAGIDVASGQLTGKAAFTTRGASPFDMAANLAGSGEVAVRDGMVRGFDLADVSRRLNDIDDVASLLGLLQAGMGGGQTRFSSLTATFAAERGNLVSRDIALQAEAGQGRGTATVNLPAYSLDSRILFTLTAHPGMPPFALRLEGPLDNPRRGFETNDLQAWLVSRGVGRLLKGRGGEAGKVIERLLGGGEGEPRSPPAQSQPQGTPGDILKDLLQGLGR